MVALKESIRRVGREAADHQDSLRSESDSIARARLKFLGEMRSTRRERVPTCDLHVGRSGERIDASRSIARGWPRMALIAAVAFAVIGLSTIGFVRGRHRALSFTVAGAPGIVGAWIAGVPVQFSDGSQFVLDRDASARVVSVDNHGARMMLEHGVVHASVTHTESSRWSIGAGPYEVRVTGTRFDVAWDPAARTFALDLHEGSVVVVGCALAERSVHAGESVRVTCNDGAAAIASSSPATTSASSAVTNPIAPIASVVPVPSATIEPSATVAIGTAPSAPTWTDLARAGKFKDAYAIVRDDFDARCNSVDAGDVLLLADVARYSGDSARGKHAWLVLRVRFPNDARAATAAFFLGRAAFDEGAFDETRRWLSTSLSEAPSGPLACEAMGRLIETCQRVGDSLAAKDAAKSYLSACPNGPHAKLAESVAGE